MHFRRHFARFAASAVAIGILLAGAGADAQPASERNRVVSINLGLQFISDAFMNRVPFRQHDENSTFDAHYDVNWHHAVDGGVAGRVWKNLALGIEGSHVAAPVTTRIEAEVPHPFFFGFPRLASGVREGLTRREIGLHIQGQYWWFLRETFLFRTTWGPTVFIARQDLVSEIGTREAGADFDQVALTSHRARTVTAGAIGVNVGFDGSWFLTERLGLGVRLRYSRGTATVRPGNHLPAGLELGGTHIAGGLRVTL